MDKDHNLEGKMQMIYFIFCLFFPGLMNCILLNRLLGVFPDLMERVNFWVGTSNGGMLAMAFAFGYTPSLCRTILELAGRRVFSKKESYGAINKAKFSSQALKILCEEVILIRICTTTNQSKRKLM